MPDRAFREFLRARGVQCHLSQRDVSWRGHRPSSLFSRLFVRAVEPSNAYIGSDALDRQRRALADTDAHCGEAVAAAAPLELERDGAREARARHAERMAERDRAAIRIDMAGIIRKPEPAQAGKRLRGERLVELDNVEARWLELQPFGQFADRRDRAHAHHARRDAGGRVAENAGDRREPMRFRGLARGDDERRRAVVDAGGVACGYAAALAHDPDELRQRLERRVGARMLVARDPGHAPFAILDLDWENFRVERPLRLSRRGPLLRALRERVLVGARDLVLVSDVLGRLGHRIDAIELFHRWIDETPADG